LWKKKTGEEKAVGNREGGEEKGTEKRGSGGGGTKENGEEAAEGKGEEDADERGKKQKKKNPFITIHVPGSVKLLRALLNPSPASSPSSSSSTKSSANLISCLLICICHCINNAFLDAIEQCPFLGLLNDRIHALIVDLRKAAYSGVSFSYSPSLSFFFLFS
jgi:hypothetical protein